MTTLDDLRATFEEHAVQAGDGQGMVQAARAGAARVRRRRRITTAVLAAATVVAVTVPVTVTLRSRSDTPGRARTGPAGPSGHRRPRARLRLPDSQPDRRDR